MGPSEVRAALGGRSCGIGLGGSGLPSNPSSLPLTSSANSSIFSSLSFHICKLDTIMVLNTGQSGGSNELLLAKCLAGSSIKKVLYELCFS